MKPLTYNSPERAKERAEVVPLTMDEIETLVLTLDKFTPYSQFPTELLQRLLDDYANLKHFHSVANGWQGLNALQVNYEIVKTNVCPECGDKMEVDYSKFLTSMPPKRQVTCTNEKCKHVIYITI